MTSARTALFVRWRTTALLTLCQAAPSQFPNTIYRWPDPRTPAALAGGEDIDGDGVADQIAAMHSLGGVSAVRIYSGRTGVLVREVSNGVGDQLGRFIALLGDLDGDGGSDYALGAPFDNTRGFLHGAVYVFSGLTHRPLATFLGTSSGDEMGPCASIGDVDRDGVRDLLIAAPGDDTAGSDAGEVTVVSGRTLTALRRH